MFVWDFDHFPLDLEPLLADARSRRKQLETGSGAGSDFLGWLDLPVGMQSQLGAIATSATRLAALRTIVVVGIGGSYLGSRAVLEALGNPFGSEVTVYYAGHQLDAGYHQRLMEHLRSRDYGVIVISKSGTTTEPGLAFRLLLADLRTRFGEAGLRERIVAITDGSKGSLRALAKRSGLETFVIPDDVGGRFSVLTPVGLLPIAAAGFDVGGLLNGAAAMMEQLRGARGDSLDSPALAYACARNAAYRAGKKIEVLASYTSGLHFVAEWWKQLYGESEGKDGKGLFPAAVDLTSDLHSMGQWLQDAERTIFETVIDIEKSDGPIVPRDDQDEDGLNYLAGKSLNDVNRTALRATMQAHADGGVPVMRLVVPGLDAFSLGGLLYMFEYACAVSGYMLGVNPFDQPGVEAYKKNMFRLLGKAGA